MNKIKLTKEEKANQLLEIHELNSFAAEMIDFHKEAIKGFTLAYNTDPYTIPVKKVKVRDLFQCNKGSYKPDEKINPKTPIILNRKKEIIAGIYQYRYAKKNHLTKINAVYMDSLLGKLISPDSLKKQFKDDTICTGFAYKLHALLYAPKKKLSYPEFCYYFPLFWNEKYIASYIYNYIFIFNNIAIDRG